MFTFQNEVSIEMMVQDDSATAANKQEEEYREDSDQENFVDDRDPYQDFRSGDVYTDESDGRYPM